MISYLLTASLYMLLFYSLYALLFRRNTFFGLNRAYLVGTLLAALLLPFVEVPAHPMAILPLQHLVLPTFVVDGSTQSTTPAHWLGLPWFWLLYGLGSGIMLARLLLNLRAVLRVIRQGVPEPGPAYTRVMLPHDRLPSFSFGRFLVLNQTDALAQSATLIRHEEAHIRQQHTADILFLELVKIGFWFNPALWLYKHSLQEVHEFLADRAVLQTPQPDYPQQLVAYVLKVSPADLITPFVSRSTLKQRIIMLQKPASSRKALVSYALILPLTGLLLMCTQAEQDQPQSTAARQAATVKGDILTVVDQSPEFPGGMAGLGNFIGRNIKYPAAAEKAGIEGRVFVSFVVTTSGDVTDIRILKDVGFGTGEEAKRVVSLMPRWIPAKHKGEVVNVRFNLPINFQLTEDKVETAFLEQFKRFTVNGNVVSPEQFLTLCKNQVKANKPSLVINANAITQAISLESSL